MITDATRCSLLETVRYTAHECISRYRFPARTNRRLSEKPHNRYFFRSSPNMKLNLIITEKHRSVNQLFLKEISTVLLFIKSRHLLLQYLYKLANMISITNRMMHLNCQRQQSLTILLVSFTHCKDWQQPLSFSVNI